MRGMQPDNQRLESLNTLAKALRAGGLQEPARRNGIRPRFQIEGALTPIMANFEIDEHQKWETLKAHYKSADGIWPM